jgi:hypothetical protein
MTAVASLKRFIAEDRHRVRLDDLFMNEANRLIVRLREDFPFQGGPSPTLELAAQRIKRMDAATEILRALFFHGCRLATPPQETTMLRALALLTPPEDQAGYNIWTDMARYPMASIIYAAAAGALVSQNWGLLRQLLEFRYRVNGRERVACDRLNAMRALPTEAANALFSQRRHTPASDHIVSLLKPLLTEIHSDYELLFDELEVWVILACYDVAKDIKNLASVWTPTGRFYWRAQMNERGHPNLLLADANAAGEKWQPLAAGWFGGRIDLWSEVRAAFIDMYQRRASTIF